MTLSLHVFSVVVSFLIVSIAYCEGNFHYRNSFHSPKLGLPPEDIEHFLLDLENIASKLDFKYLTNKQTLNQVLGKISDIYDKGFSTFQNETSTQSPITSETTSASHNATAIWTVSKGVPSKDVPTTIKPATRSPPLVVSDVCLDHTIAIINGLIHKQRFALEVIDALGKPQSNIFGDLTASGVEGIPLLVKWIGDFDECRAVRNNTEVNGTYYDVKGQYCLGTLPTKVVFIALGVCVPQTCSETDALNLMKTIFPNTISMTCKPVHRPPFDTRATAVFVVLMVFVALMVLGTVYDVYIIHWSKHVKAEIVEPIVANDEIVPLLKGRKIAERKEPGTAGKLLLAFSLYTNIKKILSTNQGEGTLTCINGIRFITMTWVILGHTLIFPITFSVIDNVPQWLPERLSRVTFGPVYNAFPAVDTFFALSGLLVTYLIMKELKSKNGKMNWPMFYFHRFWRLTPPYMLILMTYVVLFPYVGDGPIWPKDGTETNYCRNSWYRNFLYVNNLFVEGYELCMAWTWYLANDMQFYIISQIIILPLFNYHIIGLVILTLFSIAGVVACGVLTAQDNLPANIFDGGDSQKFFSEYIKPWNRITPYLIGMYTGYLLYRTNCKFKMNKFINILAWLGFAALACTVLYGLHDDVNGHRLSRDIAALYTATHRLVWGMCICWVIFACSTGNGGIINTFLSWKGFIPLSRLSYCAYLVHPIVIYYYSLRRRREIHFDDTEVSYEFVGNLVFSYAIAFVASLTFESPMMGLEKAILKRHEKKR